MISTREMSFPLSRTHCGVPLANGRMGVLVWGSGRTLCVTINRGDIWDHREVDRIMPGQRYDDLVAAYDPDDAASLEAIVKKIEHPYDKTGPQASESSRGVPRVCRWGGSNWN